MHKEISVNIMEGTHAIEEELINNKAILVTVDCITIQFLTKARFI